MTGSADAKPKQKICEDCILRNSCEYIPEENQLIRCLDKVTEKKQPSPEKAEGE